MALATIPDQVRDPDHNALAAVIREVNTSPELRLLAAVVARGLQDARDGDSEALTWLESADGLSMIARLTPAELEPENVQSAILEAAGRPIEPYQAAPGPLRQRAMREGLTL